MEARISATELARKLGDVLGKIRYRGETFVVEKNGKPVARLTGLPDARAGTAAEVLGAWRESAGSDPAFADDLELVNRTDLPADDPWAS